MKNASIITLLALASSSAAIYASILYAQARKPKKQPLKKKTPSDSIVDALEVLTPGQCTSLSTSYGGELLSMVDKIAGACAAKHAEGIIVTVSMSEIHFQIPARVGDIVILTAKLTAAFKSSMEVEVLVYVEHPITGKQSFCCRALLKFVALDRKRRPRPVHELIPETPEEIKAHRDAVARNEEFRNRKQIPAEEIDTLWKNHIEKSTSYLPKSMTTSLDDMKLEMTKIVMPANANPLGILFGGQLLQWMEHAAYVSASRLCRSLVLTVGLDQMSFLVQIPVGSVVIIRCQVNRVFITSLEIGVRVEMASWLNGNIKSSVHCNSGYFTFVSIDENTMRPKEIKHNVVASNDKDKLRYIQADERRMRRMATRERSRSTPDPYLHRYSVAQT